MSDMTAIVLVTTGVCLATGLAGALALHLVRSRALVWSIIVAALVPLLAVSASVIVNVGLMVLSTHDSTAVSIALGCATVIGALLSFLLGRRVAQGSRRLTNALLALGSDARRGTGDSPPKGIDRIGEPREIAALAAELDSTRDRLALAQQRARALQDSRRELVAFLCQDLRTPLAGLRALTEGLQDGVVEDRPVALRQMRETVDRMTGLVGDLFALSRPDTSMPTSPVQRSMVSLLELAHDVTGELEAHARRREVRLRLDVRAGDDRLAVRGNSDELARALTNVVGTAIRHTAAGGTVAVSAHRAEDGRIAVSVTDGCGGIPDPDLNLVFDVGWRATPERGTVDAGAGLGPTLTRGLIGADSGSIAVEDVPGGGRFGLLLPAIPAEG